MLTEAERDRDEKRVQNLELEITSTQYHARSLAEFLMDSTLCEELITKAIALNGNFFLFFPRKVFVSAVKWCIQHGVDGIAEFIRKDEENFKHQQIL